MARPAGIPIQAPQQFRLRGMVRDRIMPADAPIACAEPENMAIFDLMFDIRFSEPPKGDNARRRRARIYDEVKGICGSCPVRETCLSTNGADLEMGVVGGMTDQERADLFGGAA